MHELFSERTGLITKQSKASVPNEVRESALNMLNNGFDKDQAALLNAQKNIMGFLGIPQDTPTHPIGFQVDANNKTLHDYVTSCDWNKLYDFIEMSYLRVAEQAGPIYEQCINTVFRINGLKYRIENGYVIPIVNDMQLKQMREASDTGIVDVDKSYNDAVALLSKRSNPDYAAVIAKASNALEAMAVTINKTNSGSKDTLGQAFDELKHHGIQIDERLEEVMKKIYKYACNPGIRHGGIDSVEPNENDAVYILTICASCINYLNHLYQTIITSKEGS